MKVLVICAHPNLDISRINRRWVEELKKNEDITVHVLSLAYPDENIDVACEQKLLEEHQRIVLQFPFYWYMAPSILKKWQDAVLSYGWAYGPGGNKLKGKEFLLAVSTGGPAEAYQAGGHNHYTMSELLRPYQAMCNLLGGRYLSPYTLHGAGTASEEQVEESARSLLNYIINVK